MLYIFVAIAAVVCAPLIIYIFTRPTLPKKYPIFNLSDVVEDHYIAAVSQLRNAASDSLSLYSTYNAEAFAQLLLNNKSKFQQLHKDLDGFDAYWKRFVRFKAQASFVTTCRSYSEARRQKIASALQFLDDVDPFMQVTTTMRQLMQTAHNTMIVQSDMSGINQITDLKEKTAAIYTHIDELRPKHPVTIQYREYICDFLAKQQKQLGICLNLAQHNTNEAIIEYNNYIDTWSRFNDSHVIDLINDEFTWQTDMYAHAMSELRQQTDYAS